MPVAGLALVSVLPALSAADPHPLVPPLACCENYHTCPSAAAACIAVPYLPLSEPCFTGAAPTRRWSLTIQEAVRIAISNSEAVRNLGLVEAASRNDTVRSVITSYDPLAASAEADAQWGIFDPLLTTSMQWDRMDIPPGTSFSGIGNRPPQLDTADFYTSLEQLMPLGSRVRLDMVTDYLFNPSKPPGLDPNPQYFSYTQFGFTQPLLRGLGVDVTMAPIKIAAAEAERTDWQFKQEMLALVRSVETTYWGLYAQQQNLKAINDALPYFQEVLRLREQQAQALTGTESESYRASSELLLFQQRRLDTMARVAEQQLVLRNLLGLPPCDNVDIHLLALPVTTRPTETLGDAVMQAVNSRPDVLRQRLAVYVAQQERLLANDALRPQLDVQGYWRLNGLGETLDESYDVKYGNDYRDWQLGVFFQIPLGRRQARAGQRAAELRLSRERAMLQQTAHQASFEVADAYRRLDWVYQQREIAASRYEALSKWSGGARAQFENPPPGMSTTFALELYLQNLREMVDASLSSNALLADYNSALARLAEVKGTLLADRLVQVSGDLSGELPPDLPIPQMQQPESVLPGAPVPPTAPEPPRTEEGTMLEAPGGGLAQAPVDAAPVALPPVEMQLPESIRAEAHQAGNSPHVGPEEPIAVATPETAIAPTADPSPAPAVELRSPAELLARGLVNEQPIGATRYSAPPVPTLPNFAAADAERPSPTFANAMPETPVALRLPSGVQPGGHASPQQFAAAPLPTPPQPPAIFWPQARIERPVDVIELPAAERAPLPSSEITLWDDGSSQAIAEHAPGTDGAPMLVALRQPHGALPSVAQAYPAATLERSLTNPAAAQTRMDVIPTQELRYPSSVDID